MGNRFLKENPGEFVKLLEKESGIHGAHVGNRKPFDVSQDRGCEIDVGRWLRG